MTGARTSLRHLSIPDLFERAMQGDRRAIGRLLSEVEHGGPRGDQIAGLAHPAAGKGHVVGLTGAPGAGKSTITGRLAAEAGRRSAGPVAVLAIDPSSPITGGAILGDRVRMDSVIERPDTFVRSMATRGSSGGLALAAPGAVRVLDACGFSPVIIETVGVGQVEVDIAANSDTTVVVVTPGWGDAIQANKAGLLEMADVFVVNKADRPGADDARRDLEYMLDLGAHPEPGTTRWRAPILKSTATEGAGIADLWTAIEDHRSWLEANDELAPRRNKRDAFELAGRIEVMLSRIGATRMHSHAGAQLVEQIAQRKISPAAAAQRLLEDVL